MQTVSGREVPNDVDGIGLWRALVQDAPSPRTDRCASRGSWLFFAADEESHFLSSWTLNLFGRPL